MFADIPMNSNAQTLTLLPRSSASPEINLTPKSHNFGRLSILVKVKRKREGFSDSGALPVLTIQLRCFQYGKDTEAYVGEKEFTEVLLGVEGDEFCRIVERQFTPFIGQVFLHLEEVLQFYKMYALACGFDKANKVVKVEDCSPAQGGELTVSDKPRRKTKVRRIGCQARLKIGASKTYNMCKEHVNGFENIGATLNDFKNFSRDVKCYINERDGQLFIDRFKNLAETRDDFYFDYEVDVDNSLVRAVWANGTSRCNYSVFGDAVSFDPTYSANIENEESFTWLFGRFLDAVGGKEPHYIITDQDPGIIASVANVFKTARHRFCMWHIMNKVPVKYGSNAKDFQVFIRKLNAIVWDEDLEADEFDSRWGEIMAEHERYTQKKLDNDNRQSSPKLVTQLPIEIHGARVYTHELFDDFQQERISSTSDLSARGFSEKDGVEITTLKDGLFGKVFDIQFNPGTYQVNCTCMKFERAGLLCRHIISIFSSNGVNSIPDCYLAKRWCKDVVGTTHENVDLIDGRQIKLTNLWSDVYEAVGLLRDRGKDDIQNLCSLIREFRQNLEPACEDLTKEQEIEQLLGCKAVDEIKILPPKHAKNKGSGRRLLSNKTLAVAKAIKSKRMCSNCKQMAHHDKRNCPNQYAEFPPSAPSSSSDDDGIDEEVEEDDDSE
ncbi:hypothetical protein RND81_12G068900 [Saponaria officinalis]|uniref:SWIM-type domain-containing protein n=1 Tax=Saponaria officinalis TaxID=3572 RepID=A0AAW1H7I3_SAPOF